VTGSDQRARTNGPFDRRKRPGWAGLLLRRRNFGARRIACGERSRAGSPYLFHIVRTDTTFST